MYRPWWLDTKWLWIIILQCCWGNLYPTLSLLTKEMQSFQKFNTKQFTSYTINSCTNSLICMRIYNTWIKILQIDNYLKNEMIITFSFPEVRVVSSTFIKISKNAKKVYQKHSDQSFLEQTVLLAVSSWPILSTKCYNLAPLSLG